MKMTEVSDDRYVSDTGWTMARETGLTPNGNPVASRWVLRDHEGKWIDYDQYRNDLAEQHDLILVSSSKVLE